MKWMIAMYKNSLVIDFEGYTYFSWGSQVVIVLAFYFDDLSSNLAEVYNSILYFVRRERKEAHF